ncbi:ribosome small subunit-dependent GTPase A [Spiribacter insolitus]|uniref:Small ribosomal subunit biogenesis GTPase RsgA n=1 Tax=Spiribacter insolitus TaxID=3122417 RepID=A0ABV3T530_9GAMM
MSQKTGLVIMSTADHCLVDDMAGGLHRCQLRGRRAGRPVCGDRVRWTPGTPEGVIDGIEPRHNLVERGDFRGRPRPLVANIDRLVIVVAPEPAPDSLLVDRYLVLGQTLGLAMLLWCNKADLELGPSAPTLAALQARCRRLGIPVLEGSTTTGAGLAGLRNQTGGETIVLVGQSGVGKSSITQALIPALSLRIGEISATSGQGRHTTSETTLFRREDGGALIDSPGVRTLRLDHLGSEAVDRAYPEILEAARECRFRDCQHSREPDCGVRQGLAAGAIEAQRFENWRRLRRETKIAENPERGG